MGGFAGWIGDPAAGEAAIAPMLEALAHRGRGDAGALALSGAGMLGARGPQPLADAQAGIALVLDGEIANRQGLRAQLAQRGYRFASEDSAEVLLRAYQHWDKEAVRHLRGAFAFALWDARKQRLLLARDRFGEKPLHLHEGGAGLRFASEAKGLLAHPGVPREADLQAVWDLLALRYVPGPRTLFKGVRKLAPGSYALWQFGRLHETRYWAPPDGEPAPARPPAQEPVGAFVERFEEAVKLRLEGHAHAGAFLSGGFDGAAVAAAMARQGARVSTFSAGVEGDSASELPAAARLAKQLGTVHHEIVLSPRELLAHLPRAVAMRDAPLARPADIAVHLLAREAARSVEIVLTGDGGDEILGGHRRHAAERYAWLLGQVPTLLAVAMPLAGASLAIRDPRSRWARWTGLQDGEHRSRLSILTVQDEKTGARTRGTPLRQMLHYEQSGWLPDHVLERTDRMAMAASLETRAPFVDHRIAEHVSALPDEARVKGFATKRILRRAMPLLAPGLRPRKRGLRIPAAQWLRTDLRETLLEHLGGAGSLTRPYYDGKVLDAMVGQHLAGKRNHEEILWTLLNLEIWHRTLRPA